MAKALQIYLTGHGGSEVMRLHEYELTAPGLGEVQIEQTAIGLNFIDIYHRRGYYPHSIPGGIGLEAAGRIVATGEGVTEFNVGDRVGYCGLMGAYSSHRNAPVDRLVRIPDQISDAQAAAILLKGMTVEYLLCRLCPVQKGDDVLFYSASGGVGHIAGHWGHSRGARMIGVTSGPENCDAILKQGYHVSIDRLNDDILARVMAETRDQGVRVVYDGIGESTFETSLSCLKVRGMMVSFGAISGHAPAIAPVRLQQAGSVFLTRPVLADYTRTPVELRKSAADVFSKVASGDVPVQIDQTWPLSDVCDAHRALEAGDTTAASVLIP